MDDDNDPFMFDEQGYRKPAFYEALDAVQVGMKSIFLGVKFIISSAGMYYNVYTFITKSHFCLLRAEIGLF